MPQSDEPGHIPDTVRVPARAGGSADAAAPADRHNWADSQPGTVAEPRSNPPDAAAGPPPADPPPAPANPDFPPELADHPRYELLERLGAGGMGEVYMAEHRIMGRTVALKVMAAELTADPAAADRFRREVRAAAKLAHPNIVTAHDADEAGGRHFLVMEYVDGMSLDRLVRQRGPLPVASACQLIRQAALGLQHAHDRGMVHRDVKPQNLMLSRGGQVKVLDLGLAKFVQEAELPPLSAGSSADAAAAGLDPNLTSASQFMGTPDYLSPEQARNSARVDARADVYSLGCTLYFLLTGRPPFRHAKGLLDKLLAHVNEPPPAVRDLRPDVPAGLAEVLRRMMAKKPGERFTTATEAAAALVPFAAPAPPPPPPTPAGGGRSGRLATAPPAPAARTGKPADTPRAEKPAAAAPRVVEAKVVDARPADTPFEFRTKPVRVRTRRRRRKSGMPPAVTTALAIALLVAVVAGGGWAVSWAVGKVTKPAGGVTTRSR